MLLRTQLLYNLPLIIKDMSLLVSSGTSCLNLFQPIRIQASTAASASQFLSKCKISPLLPPPIFLPRYCSFACFTIPPCLPQSPLCLTLSASIAVQCLIKLESILYIQTISVSMLTGSNLNVSLGSAFSFFLTDPSLQFSQNLPRASLSSAKSHYHIQLFKHV